MKNSLYAIFTACLIFPTIAFAERVELKSCYAEWDETRITVGNALVERVWEIENGLLKAVSFKDKQNDFEWLRGPGRQLAPHPGVDVGDDKKVLTFSSSSGRISPVQAESLVVNLQAKSAQESFDYQFQVFPDSAGVTVTFTASELKSTEVKDEGEKEVATGIEGLTAQKKGRKPAEALEDFLLSPLHLRYTQVELKDQTDDHDQLVFERTWLPLHDRFEARCNVFHLEDVLTEKGLIFVKLAPLPHARPVSSKYDVKVLGEGRRVMFAGQGYPWTVLVYAGGRAGRIAAMQDYQRALREYQSGRDGMFLSNTWGDRSRDARVNVEFLTKEVEAGAKLGVDVVQVDDGWQAGKTGNSAFGKGAWGNFRSANPDFWKPHPERFPNGLKPLVDLAKTKGMKFGLWFGPDAENSMENWEYDADMLLSAFAKEGVEYVKIDAVEMKTLEAQANLSKFYDKVLNETKGRVVFDTDVTAGLRPGYFGTVGAGPIFLENRYTDWKRYYPHQTLRNLWELSAYVDPLRLRMEFLNQVRNAEKYGDDPLAPAAYPADTLFASVMFSNPLGWFETSNLPGSYFEKIPKLVKAWKAERDAIFTGTIVPIGKAPDGVAWTGFCSTAKDKKRAIVVVFRELNEVAEWSTELPLFNEVGATVEVIGGKGFARHENGRLEVLIPDKLQYVFLKVRAETDGDLALQGDRLVALEGRLKGVKVDSGETTGWQLTYMESGKKRGMEVDMSGVDLADIYDGRDVSVRGFIVPMHYPSRGVVLTFKAVSVEVEQ